MLPYTKLSGNARRFKTPMGMSLQEFNLLFAKVKAHPGAERPSKRPRSRARRTARQRVWAARMRTSRSTNPGRGDLLPICGGTGPEAPASEKPAQPCCRRSRVPCMSRDGHDGNAKRQRCAQAKRQHVEVLRGMGGPVCTLGQNHWGNWRRQGHKGITPVRRAGHRRREGKVHVVDWAPDTENRTWARIASKGETATNFLVGRDVMVGLFWPLPGGTSAPVRLSAVSCTCKPC